MSNKNTIDEDIFKKGKIFREEPQFSGIEVSDESISRVEPPKEWGDKKLKEEIKNKLKKDKKKLFIAEDFKLEPKLVGNSSFKNKIDVLGLDENRRPLLIECDKQFKKWSIGQLLNYSAMFLQETDHIQLQNQYKNRVNEDIDTVIDDFKSVLGGEITRRDSYVDFDLEAPVLTGFAKNFHPETWYGFHLADFFISMTDIIADIGANKLYCYKQEGRDSLITQIRPPKIREVLSRDGEKSENKMEESQKDRFKILRESDDFASQDKIVLHFREEYLKEKISTIKEDSKSLTDKVDNKKESYWKCSLNLDREETEWYWNDTFYRIWNLTDIILKEFDLQLHNNGTSDNEYDVAGADPFGFWRFDENENDDPPSNSSVQSYCYVK